MRLVVAPYVAKIIHSAMLRPKFAYANVVASFIRISPNVSSAQNDT